VSGSGKHDGRPGPGGAVSIIDVAVLAGVSRQTVSNVVNDRGGFSEATRSKVQQVIAETGYKPNRAARQLRTNQARHIGFPLHTGHVDPRNPFTLLFLKAVADAVKPLGHSLIVFACGDHDQETFSSWARSGEIDGFVFDRVVPGDYRTAVCAQMGIPFSVMGRTGEDEAQSWVEVDNRSGMSSLVDYLAGRGRRRFAYLDNGGSEPWVVERIEAAHGRIREHGLELPDWAVLRGEYTALPERLDQVLRRSDRPDAVIAGSDALALLAATRVREAGLGVGTDVGVAGFDGGMQGWLVDETLTTVRIPATRLGEMLIARLMALLDGAPPPECGLVLPTELVIGSSG
jgi:DNA-binding LacI/PurR family transcriptional regulator